MMTQSERKKVFVKVRADHEVDGQVIPLMFKTETEDKIIIDRILDIRICASLKAGGQGMRYTCRIGQECIYLFHDQAHWFLEEI